MVAGADQPLEHTQLVERNDLDRIDVVRRAGEAGDARPPGPGHELRAAHHL